MTEPEWRRERTDRDLRDSIDEQHPERTSLRPETIDGIRHALDVVDGLWTPTIERARRLPAHALHERVDGEWSFVETLRHLVFAWDAWLTRMVLRIPDAYDPVAVAPEAMPDDRVELDPVLDVRADRRARVRAHLDGMADADLATVVGPPDATGHPQAEHPVRWCFHVVLAEEWWHHRYATRDLPGLLGP